ncbi:MAG: hypothetical protein ACPGN3_00520 [Opitutales bacterium]
MMHGLIANILVSAGRSILGEATAQPQPAAKADPNQKVTPFSEILNEQGIKDAKSIQEIFELNPKINDSQLLEISQNLKLEILQDQKGLNGERAPLSSGEWTITPHTDPSGQQSFKITDLEGKSMQIAQDAPIYQKVQLLQQIQEHLNRPTPAVSGL